MNESGVAFMHNRSLKRYLFYKKNVNSLFKLINLFLVHNNFSLLSYLYFTKISLC